VWRRPVDEDTARFLGCAEVLPATVTGGVARCELGEVALPWADDGRVRLGLRPTALRPAEAGVGGEVVHRVHRRDHVRLRVRVGERVVDAVAGMGDVPSVGASVRLAMDEDGVALLPA